MNANIKTLSQTLATYLNPKLYDTQIVVFSLNDENKFPTINGNTVSSMSYESFKQLDNTTMNGLAHFYGYNPQPSTTRTRSAAQSESPKDFIERHLSIKRVRLQ